MKDRKARAPGRYSAIIPAGDITKLQTGKAFQITLVRNDDPEEEGTPYNKEAVLPDDLAGLLCLGGDSTPADVFRYFYNTIQTAADSVSEMLELDPDTSRSLSDALFELAYLVSSDHRYLWDYGLMYDDEETGDIASHAQDTNNPHEVTAEQIGAVTLEGVDKIATEMGSVLVAVEGLAYDNKAAIENHIGNAGGENPHGITAEQIGAAPDGFGLGEKMTPATAWKFASASGFSRSSNDSPDGSLWWGITSTRDSGVGTQVAFSDAGGILTEARRIYKTSGQTLIGEWEYVNPPMRPGEEYRTTQRWNGKPVYTKLLFCGEAADEQTVDLEDQFGIIRVEGCILNADGIPICPLPNGQIAWLETYADVGNIILRCNDGNYCGDGNTFYIQLWYVK